MQEESKLDRFKVGTKKFIGRTNERLKQRIGRSSEAVIVKDDKWQVHVANFNRQQALALKLHREVKGYIASLKTMEGSAHSLMEVVREMHEFTWPGNMNLVKALQSLEKLNMELSNSMVDTLLVPVNNYVETFPEIKERMNKRERKLLDYTRCKRNLDTLKKGDKISHEKLGLAQEEFTEHKMIYEEVNNELSEDLPQFWDSRKPFISRFLDTFFEQNVGYSKEFSQVYSECHAAVEPLKESLRGDPPTTRQIGNVERFFIISDNARKFKRQSLRKSFRKSNGGGGGGGFKRSLSMGAIRKTKKEEPVPQSMSNIAADPYVVPTQQANVYTSSNAAKASPVTPVKKENETSGASDIAPPLKPSPRSSKSSPVAANIETEIPLTPKASSPVMEEAQNGHVEIEEDQEKDVVNGDIVAAETKEDGDETDSILAMEAQLGNESSVTPFSPTFKVEAGTTVECIHEYAAVDDDELSFATGDVITVLDWDSTDEQDEGWFMGMLKSTGKKGAFPINYTRKIPG